MSDKPKSDLVAHAAQIVAGYASNHDVRDLPLLIAQVYEALAKLGDAAPVHTGAFEPAVSVKKSVTPDYIVCLEDGKKLKMLKRYIKTAYNMTPEQYRDKWNLPADYPMVAPNYAQRRSKLAKESGLGRDKK